MGKSYKTDGQPLNEHYETLVSKRKKVKKVATGMKSDASKNSGDCVIDFNSKSLYDRYNKMLDKAPISDQAA